MTNTLTGLFVTGTGTGVGKTFVTRGLARAAVHAGTPVVALKPLETGCAPDPADALALERACGRAGVASAPGLVRQGPAVSPYAASRATGEPTPGVPALVARLRELSHDARLALIEGAGGLLVPIDPRHSMADLAAQLALPLLLVADNRLGVLSDVLAYAEVADRRGLRLAAIVLNHTSDAPDPSRADNHAILAERLDPPVLAFPRCADDDDALAAAARASGLTSLSGIPEP